MVWLLLSWGFLPGIYELEPKIPLLLLWHETAPNFRTFHLIRHDAEDPVLHMEAWSHAYFVSDACP